MHSDPGGLVTTTVVDADVHRGRLRSKSGAWRPRSPVALAGLGRLPASIVVYSVALILYLPLEAAVLAGLPPTAYWILRLLPDALIALLALAVILFGDRTARTTPVRVLWAVIAVCAFLTVANYGRAIPLVDSINAIRVVVRYLVLGLLVWWAVDARTPIGPLVTWAVLVAGAVQVAIGAVQVVARLLTAAGPATVFDPAYILFVDGSLGRYDRLGLLLMSVVIVILATGDRISIRRGALLAACMALLYVTTSRQAMVGLALGASLIAVFPAVSRPHRAVAVVLAGLSVAFVLATPATVPPLPSGEEANGPGAGGPAGVAGPAWSPPPQVDKGSTELSVDPNRNFRVFYNLDLAPWAARTEPLIGFGPRQHEADHPDPRLVARVQSAGMDWSYARRFTNNSNYASLVVQFGVVATVLFVLLLLWATARAARTAIWARGGFARFATANATAILAAAFFGPVFEIRTASVILWVTLMAAVAMRRRSDS